MTTHYIFSDTHHGAGKVVKYLKKEAKAAEKEKGKKTKISVSSTGDFWNYKANASAPVYLNHPWTDAYGKGDKKGMAQHEAGWTEKIVEKYTKESGKNLKELRPYLKGGKIKAVMGNSDYGVGDMVRRQRGKSLSDVLGGNNSAIKHVKRLQTREEDETFFVYAPHLPSMVSKYKNKDYGTIKKELSTRKSYLRLGEQAKESGKKNIVLLIHESPKPEKWYKGDKVKQRLPDALRAHYDLVVENLVNKAGGKKNIYVFHGHVHEDSSRYSYNTNTEKLGNVKVQNLNIDDVVKYDTMTGRYKVESIGSEQAMRETPLEKEVEIGLKKAEPNHNKKYNTKKAI